MEWLKKRVNMRVLSVFLLVIAIDSVSISKRLGHAQVSTTSDIYAHVIAQADAQSADMLSDIYFKKAQTG